MSSISSVSEENNPLVPITKKVLSINLPMSQQTLHFDLLDLRVSRLADQSFDATLDWDLPMHMKFRARMEPKSENEAGFRDRCVADIQTVNILFPGLNSENVRLCSQAWFAFICLVDDILETLSESKSEIILLESIDVFQNDHRTILTDANSSEITRIAQTFREYSYNLLPSQTTENFFHAICIVFRAFLHEVKFRQGQIPSTYSTYMDIRCQTIALGPFLQLIKYEKGIQDSSLNKILGNLERQAFYAAGLQNDLLGLEKDLQDGEHMNGVIVLFRELGGCLDQPNPGLLRKSIDEVNRKHNEHIGLLLDSISDLIGAEVADMAGYAPTTCSPDAVGNTIAQPHQDRAEDKVILPKALRKRPRRADVALNGSEATPRKRPRRHQAKPSPGGKAVFLDRSSSPNMSSEPSASRRATAYTRDSQRSTAPVLTLIPTPTLTPTSMDQFCAFKNPEMGVATTCDCHSSRRRLVEVVAVTRTCFNDRTSISASVLIDPTMATLPSINGAVVDAAQAGTPKNFEFTSTECSRIAPNLLLVSALSKSVARISMAATHDSMNDDDESDWQESEGAVDETHRDPIQVRRSHQPWTPSEDEILKQWSGKARDLSEIIQHFPGRTVGAIRTRWHAKFRPAPKQKRSRNI